MPLPSTSFAHLLVTPFQAVKFKHGWSLRLRQKKVLRELIYCPATYLLTKDFIRAVNNGMSGATLFIQGMVFIENIIEK